MSEQHWNGPIWEKSPFITEPFSFLQKDIQELSSIIFFLYFFHLAESIKPLLTKKLVFCSPSKQFCRASQQGLLFFYKLWTLGFIAQFLPGFGNNNLSIKPEWVHNLHGHAREIFQKEFGFRDAPGKKNTISMARSISNRVFKWTFFPKIVQAPWRFSTFFCTQTIVPPQLNLTVPGFGKLSPLVKPLPAKDNRNWEI